MRQHSIILINLFVNSEKIVNPKEGDYIFSCDNIIYDCYIYLYFTLKNALKLFKYRIEFKEFSIWDLKGLANALDKLNCSYIIKQILFLKKIYSFLLTIIFISPSTTSMFQTRSSPCDKLRLLTISLGMLVLKVVDFEFAWLTFVTNLSIIIPLIIFFVSNILVS